MAGTTALQQMKGPSTLMRSTLRHSSRSVSHTVLLMPAMPALLTKISILPKAFRVSSRTFSTAAGSVTSTFKAMAPAPISLAVFSASGRSLSQIATLAPEATKRSAIARPNPCAPPVTAAPRPLRSILFIELSSHLSTPHGEERGTRVSNHEADCLPSFETALRASSGWGSSLKRPAAVDDVRDAGRERALVACQIHGEQSNFLRRPQSSHRLPGDEHVAPAGTGGRGAVQHRGRLDGAGTNAIATDALGDEIGSDGACQ